MKRWISRALVTPCLVAWMWTEISTQTCLWAPWLILLLCSGEPPGYQTLLAGVASFQSHTWSCRVCPASHSLLSHPMNSLCPGPDPFYMSPKRSSSIQEPSIWNSPTVRMVAWSGEARLEGRAKETASGRFPCLFFVSLHLGRGRSGVWGLVCSGAYLCPTAWT